MSPKAVKIYEVIGGDDKVIYRGQDYTAASDKYEKEVAKWHEWNSNQKNAKPKTVVLLKTEVII